MTARPADSLPDPAALRSPRMVRFFAGVMERTLRRSFHGVRIARPGLPDLPGDRPVLVYCNHPGWWDAALLIVLAGRGWPDRRSFGPMDAAAIEQYGFMRRIGLFPVRPDTAARAVAFMKTALRLLDDPATMLWVTAQGHFADVRERPVRLRGGIAHLLHRRPGVTVLPLAIEYSFWAEKQPEALCRFGPPIDGTAFAHLDAAGWQALLEQRLTAEMDTLATHAMARDADAFVPLIEGSAGVGGIYDVWRRLKAWAGGRKFDPSHGAVLRHRR